MCEFDLGDILNFVFESQDRGEVVDKEMLLKQFPRCEELLQPILRMLKQGERTFGKPRQRSSGDVVADYRLVEKVGQGSNGEVWRAETLNTRQTVALKLIHPRYAESLDKATLARFEAESNALLLLNHENIARVLRPSPIQADTPFIAMEFLGGPPKSKDSPAESITQYCSRTKLGIRERIELFVPVCRAISYAHRNTIVHRDIKPSNILVTFREQQAIPKVIDFGLAKRLVAPLQDLTTASLTVEFVGTMMYAAPEQADFGKETQTARSTSPDIFSLGVVLFELLTGTTPCASDQGEKVGVATIIKELTSDRELPRMSDKSKNSVVAQRFATALGMPAEQLQASLRVELDWVVDKALKKSPAERYGSADELADDLERYLGNMPVSVGRPSLTLKLQKFWRRNQALATAGLIAIAAVILGIIGLGIGLIRATSAEAEARIAANDATTAQQQEASQRELAEAMLRFVEDDLLKLTTALGQAKALGDHTSGVHKNASLRELLDRARVKLVDDTQLAPNVRAELLRLIGVSYRSIGEYKTAEELLTRAIADFATLDTKSQAEQLDVRTELAMVRCELAKFDSGINELTMILDERERLAGPKSKELMNTLLVLGDACYLAARHEKSLEYRRKALELCQSLLGESSNEYLLCQSRIAASLHSLREVDAALAEYLRLKPLIDKAYGANSLEAMQMENYIAVAYREKGDLEQAIPLLRTAIESRERLLEPNHPWILLVKESLGMALRDSGQFVESQQLLAEILDCRRHILPATHPILLANEGELALCRAMSGDLAGALPLFQETYNRATEALGPEHEETMKLGGNLSMTLLFSEKHEEAYELLCEVLPRNVKKYGLEYRDTITCLQAFAAAAKSAAKQTEAKALIAPLLEQANAETGHESAVAKLLTEILASLDGQ